MDVTCGVITCDVTTFCVITCDVTTFCVITCDVTTFCIITCGVILCGLAVNVFVITFGVAMVWRNTVQRKMANYALLYGNRNSCLWFTKYYFSLLIELPISSK